MKRRDEERCTVTQIAESRALVSPVNIGSWTEAPSDTGAKWWVSEAQVNNYEIAKSALRQTRTLN